MKFPLGDILRKIVNPKSWLGKILSITKGHTVSIGDHDIGLSEGHGPAPLDNDHVFNKPHQPGPPKR